MMTVINKGDLSGSTRVWDRNIRVIWKLGEEKGTQKEKMIKFFR